ncbi:MAG: hypothetical protein AAGG11_07215 [Pseudomonadota bacterium]
MSKVVSIDKARSKNRKTARNKAKAAGNTLCRNGFHKWQIVKESQFDVKRGRLVTVRRCSRCDAVRTTLD